jgi:hypothetical protein
MVLANVERVHNKRLCGGPNRWFLHPQQPVRSLDAVNFAAYPAFLPSRLSEPASFLIGCEVPRFDQAHVVDNHKIDFLKGNQIFCWVKSLGQHGIAQIYDIGFIIRSDSCYTKPLLSDRPSHSYIRLSGRDHHPGNDRFNLYG